MVSYKALNTVLKALVEYRFSVVGNVIFVQCAETLKVPAKQQDRFLGEFPGISRVAIVEQSTEDEIVHVNPYWSLPRRWIAARLHVIHLLHSNACR